MPPQTENPKYEIEPVDDIHTYLDPHLQRTILRHCHRIPARACAGRESSAEPSAVEVTARLWDSSQAVPGLQIVTTAGDVVTGTVDVSDIQTVRSNPNIRSLKGASPLAPALKISVPEIRGEQTLITAELPPGSSAINGAGVIIGIVDAGCDFAHPNFRNEDGTTRLLYLWDQTRTQDAQHAPAPFGFGTEYDSNAINAALQSPDPYSRYNPGAEAHGTHVMDIAAGNGRVGGSGVAPQADLIFVHSYSNDVAQSDNLGNSRRLLDAVAYIFAKARSLQKPAVVNLSVGTNGGPHDGSSLVEQGIDNLLDERNRAVVIAASNTWEEKIHACGLIPADGSRSLRWELPFGDQTDNEVEIWYSGGAEFRLTLIDPDGDQVGPFPLGTTNLIKSNGVQLGVVFHRRDDPNNHDNQIDILFTPQLPAGWWSIVLENISGNPAEFHAWIERDDNGSSRFSDADSDPGCTISSIACGRKTIVVGSYDATNNAAISGFSAEGPTRDRRQKPEVSAPGEGVIAAESLTGSIVAKSGTSMAAPHVAGLIALLMQAASQPLTIADIRQIVLSFARRTPPVGHDWESRYGDGRIDVASSVRSLIAELATV